MSIAYMVRCDFEEGNTVETCRIGYSIIGVTDWPTAQLRAYMEEHEVTLIACLGYPEFPDLSVEDRYDVNQWLDFMEGIENVHNSELQDEEGA